MYFCPNCKYSFDITRSSKVTKTDTRNEITKIADALKKLEDKEDLSGFKATFSREEMTKNKKYQKMTDNDKIKMNQLFEELISGGAEFHCNSCNYSEPLKETTLLYSINVEDKQTKISTLEENEFICQNPILPRTHDYTCKNLSCITHKDISKKEAVFFREKGRYGVNYICCVCHYSW